MSDIVDTVVALFDGKGREPYGEDVSIAEHCLQCAALAVRDGEADSLVAAALLHDIGHLVADPDDGFGVHRHDATGADFLAGRFPEAVIAPVRLHVAAKRYRVAVDPSYSARLSMASHHTLRHQGGPMSEAEQRAFEADPHHAAALKLRAWDDLGKVEGLAVAPLDSYRPLLDRLALR